MRKKCFCFVFVKKETIKTADTLTIDTEFSIKLPANTSAYLLTKFEGQKIQKIIGVAKKRFWITLLSKSYF